MGATDLSRYEHEKDKNGEKVGNWAIQVDKGFFACKVCDPSKKLNFKSGKKDLLKHSETEKHVKNAQAAAKDSHQQATIKDMWNKKSNDDLDEKVIEFEAAFVMAAASHGVPTTVVECFTELLEKHITDSEIIKKMKLRRNKATYLANNGLADVFENETKEKLRNCYAFSASLDESEVNKTSELEVVVNIAGKDGLETGVHYNVIALEGGDAESIKTAFLDKLEEDGIDYQAKLIDVATDGCNTMIGVNNGLLKKLSDEIQCLHNTGHCRCHDLSNTMQHATEAFNPDLTFALVDIYQALGGEKGTGSSKMKRFQASCKSRGHNPKPFKKFVKVRFRSIRTCIEPVLYNYEEIVYFFKNIKSKTTKPSPRDQRLIEMFVERELETKLSLKFIYAATMEMSSKIDFFEQNKANVANITEVIEAVLLDQLQKVFEDSELKILDPETAELRKKSNAELVLIDVDIAERLSNKEIFIGNEASKMIKSLGLSANSSQLKWFFDKVMKFHITAVKFMMKYLTTPLTSPIMESLTALGQKKQSHVLTERKIKFLVSKYSKVVVNIDPLDGMDVIKKEIKSYVVDEDIKMFEENLSYEDYWQQVSNLTIGDGWRKYEVLPFFAIAMGSKFNSNSEVERSFSLMNYIHQNKNRNCLSQDSLNNILIIKSAVDSKTNKENCRICCNKLSTKHCHCSSVEITEKIRQSCRKARSKYFDSLNEAAEAKEILTEEMKAKKVNVEQEESEKIEKLKEKVEKGKKIFKSDLSVLVYDWKKKKDGEEGKNDEISDKKAEKNDKKKDVNGNSSLLPAAKRKDSSSSSKKSKKHKKS